VEHLRRDAREDRRPRRRDRYGALPGGRSVGGGLSRPGRKRARRVAARAALLTLQTHAIDVVSGEPKRRRGHSRVVCAMSGSGHTRKTRKAGCCVF
jgi:hypothetical protein